MPTGVYERKPRGTNPNDYEYVDENTIAIIINSPKYGVKKTLIDAEDYDKLKGYRWCWNRFYNRPKSEPWNPETEKLETISLHSIIMSPPEGMVVDHINGNPMDNRKQNLRICTQTENTYNQRIRVDNTSGYKGVTYKKKGKGMINEYSKPWRAQIGKSGKKTCLGTFTDKVEAAKAYDRGALKYYGEFARINFPEDKEKYLRESLDDQ